MAILYQIFIIIVLTFVSLGIFNLSKPYLINFFKKRKWLLFIVMFLVLFIPIFFKTYYVKSLAFQYLQTTLFVVTFLTYFELLRLAKIEKQKPIVGRPKPKPNRIKKGQ
ncbi:hypothetical protein [Thermobrachium celere]|uniref:Uncharacterized protein n=1 Tax=Thermobrachium celere DSM 8682 TaxID=941824 RepID=R7RPM7_9CLOT|nr:hypothetical protein [Thermobrachium celere]GFR34883.1 hypothetical protein TCEA9_06950 [Thermobrachium celere]CDF58137.1 hypothetical protein TCEL_00183 [Thermobrachium celere DSM 8682]